MKYFEANLGDVFLTDDGTETGTPCKLQVSGFDQLLMDKTGTVSNAIDGTPFVQIFDTGKKGVALEITVHVLYQAVYDDLVDLFNDAVNDGETITISLSGDPGDFDGVVVPSMPKPITPGEFRHGRLFQTVIKVITA